jgi:hypothetical protein
VVERYLADQLSDAERSEFEDYYAEHPDVLRDLDAVAGIKLGVAMLRDSGELAALTAMPPPAPRWRAGLALAATLLIAILAGTYWFSNDAGPPVILADNLDALGLSASVAASYQVQRTRSDVDAVISLPPGPQAVRLRVRPEFETPPTSYRIELSAIAATGEVRTQVAATGKLGLDADGFVTIYVNSVYLRPGNYELRVINEAVPAGDPGTNDFLIEVAAGENAPVR